MLHVGSALLFDNVAVGLTSDLTSSPTLISGRKGRKTVKATANTTGKFDVLVADDANGPWITIAKDQDVYNTASPTVGTGVATFDSESKLCAVRLHTIGANSKVASVSLDAEDVR